MRAAFVYPWFPETWAQTPIAHPSLGSYKTELGIVQAHIAMLRYARMRAGIASWWGPNTPYDARTNILLQAAEGTGFRWCLYYEREGYSDPAAASLASDLDYVEANYAKHPNHLRIRGKPVIFAYADPNDGPGMADRWKQANAGRFHVCLKLFHGFQTVAAQPDSWHEYAPAQAASDFAPYSFSVSPGFHKSGEGERLARDPARFRADVVRMDASPSLWRLVTTFNEWGEGTAVEPSLEWGTTYLDILAGKR